MRTIRSVVAAAVFAASVMLRALLCRVVGHRFAVAAKPSRCGCRWDLCGRCGLDEYAECAFHGRAS